MTFARRLEHDYRVRFDEAGPDGLLRASGYLRFAQDLAWLHSESGGFGREWYSERGLTWLVRAIELDIVDEVEYGAEPHRLDRGNRLSSRMGATSKRVHASTAPSARSRWRSPTGCCSTSAADRCARRPRSSMPSHRLSADFTPLRVPVGEPASAAARVEFGPRRSELDPMAHVNNAVYLDYVDELYSATSKQSRSALSASLPGRVPGLGRSWCRSSSAAAGRTAVAGRIRSRTASGRCFGRARNGPGYVGRRLKIRS